MPTIPALTTLGPGTIFAAPHNNNFSTIRTYVNSYCAFVDLNNTFSGTNTFSAANTFSGNNTFSGSNTFSSTNTFNNATTFGGNILAGTHNTYQIGTTGTRFTKGYFQSTVSTNGGFIVEAVTSIFSIGSIYLDATYGLVVGGYTGSTADLSLMDPGGFPRLYITTATGRVNISTAGCTVAGGGLTVSGGTTAVQALTATTGTFTGLVLTPASASGGAGFRLPHGSAPSSPTNGDLWTTTSGVFARLNGTTTQLTPGFPLQLGYAGV